MDSAFFLWNGFRAFILHLDLNILQPASQHTLNGKIWGNWYLHQYTNADTFPVVMGSFWYLKVYYILTVFGVLILRFFPKHINWFIGLCIALTLLFNIFPSIIRRASWIRCILPCCIFNRPQNAWKKIPTKAIPVLYGLVGAALIWMFWYYGGDIFYKINKNKFPPKVPYIIWALFSLTTLFVLYNRLKITKENFITYIGKNAIFFYFAQGISSSLVYFLVVPLKRKHAMVAFDGHYLWN